MGLPWVRLDTQMPSNPKILYLIEDKNSHSAFVWACSLSYSGAHGTDGFIPKAALKTIHGTLKDAKNLVDVGLWIPVPGGWEVNDWADFQPSSDEHQERKERARAAAMLRWHGKVDA